MASDDLLGSQSDGQQLLKQHLAARPNTRTVNSTGNPWVFPGSRAGQHLTAITVTNRLRDLGIDLLGGRNRALLRDLVRQCPPPIAAAQLGYSPKTALKHAALAAEPEQRYAAVTARSQ